MDKFRMINCKTIQTPLATHFRLSSKQCPVADQDKSEMSKVPYASVVGCLIYTMVLTRPDITYAISIVSRSMANPGKENWRAVKWILRCLRRTLSYSLTYGGKRQDESLVVGYVDSDYVGNLHNKRSLIWYLFTVDNCTISWKATLQNVVALSTTKAKYKSAAEAFKEAIWLRGMLSELGHPLSSVKFLCDSQSAIYLSKNQVHHEKTEHID